MATQWIPLLAAAMLEPKEVVQVFVSGSEVAVWRSATGQVQVWENRCPHRSVRFSLGRVEGESLVCAYHGWRFAAGNAACERIPAQPAQRAPASLCAKAFAVHVQDGIIWFAGFSSQPADPLAVPVTPPGTAQAPEPGDSLFCGSVVIHASMTDISTVLSRNGFVVRPDAGEPAYCWQVTSATTELRIYLTPHHAQQATLHMMLNPLVEQAESVADRQKVQLSAMQLLYSMRDIIENQHTPSQYMERNSHAEA